MPEITVIHIAIIAGAIAIGAVLGWIVRGNRCSQEKLAVSEGWQQQLEAQHTERDRLIEQNKALMEQISQFQASGTDATNRARELSTALKEALSRRDELQRELREIRSNLEVAVRQRDKLHSDMQNTDARGDTAKVAIKERDDRIFRLRRELDEWQNRLPPLLERYRERDEEAAQLEDDLASARDRIEELENLLNSGETRIEPVDPEALGDELDASNDPTGTTQTGISDVLAADDDGEPEIDEESDEVEPDAIIDEPEAEDDDDADQEEKTETEDVSASAEITELHEHETGNARDNLKLIKGVGPAIEKTLNELGIFRFHQIAEMSEYDIDRVAQRLKGFRSRIYREDWIGQARDLQLQKSGT